MQQLVHNAIQHLELDHSIDSKMDYCLKTVDLASKNQFISILSNLGLPVNNEDFVVYLDKINEIEVYKFVLIIVIFYFISKKIVDTHYAHD